MLNAGYVDVQDYVKHGWLSGVKYEDEIFDDLTKHTDSDEDKLKKVFLEHAACLTLWSFSLNLSL